MIKEYRKLHNITQVKLAKMVGVHQSSISKHERNEKDNCPTCKKIRQEIFRINENKKKIECYEAAYKLVPVKMCLGEKPSYTKKKSLTRRLINAIQRFIRW